MKTQYISLVIFILILLYLLYLNIAFKWNEIQVNTYIETIETESAQTNTQIEKNKEYLEYISTSAYKNKILKAEQSLKNKGELVIFFTKEEKEIQKNIPKSTPSSPQKNLPPFEKEMTVFQKWMFFLFKKDLRK